MVSYNMDSFVGYPKTIEACDYCGCFDAVNIEKNADGDIVFVCEKCYPMFADWYKDDIKEEDRPKPTKKFKWEEV